ncbi:uncharacterized protein LOC131000252 [Salvia miltiorrhiza]|uniref:uncharacterized protein LOC131000252 n=1 Tax=Salvia miltiorrhiza TaxID=226208 RepID=UPI0025ABEE54|nr:uncharacterized protein LOC131000252 [Salvia miltiorrhiza]
MESSGGATAPNWTEKVEDLVHGGEVDEAIAFLESTVSNLVEQFKNDKNGGMSPSSVADQLATALQDLSKLYSARGFSLRADQAFSRALQISHAKGGSLIETESVSDVFTEARDSRNEVTADHIAEHGYGESSSNLKSDDFPLEGDAEDDWEAIADCAPEELLSPQCLSGVSKLSLEDSKEDSKAQATKRRGRGTFSYKKQGLYSDSQSDEPCIDDSEDASLCQDEDLEKRNSMHGTRHILVLADFNPSTRTTDLEKLLGSFKDRFVIRWVNDTTALAVFRTPSVALEALNSTRCPFTVRLLDEDEELFSKIPPKDLEPPRQRPQTSARTAQRLIAQSMGIRLPSSFGSNELRKQEEARKNRILSRQNMRDDAWGDEDPN